MRYIDDVKSYYNTEAFKKSEVGVNKTTLIQTILFVGPKSDILRPIAIFWIKWTESHCSTNSDLFRNIETNLIIQLYTYIVRCTLYFSSLHLGSRTGRNKRFVDWTQIDHFSIRCDYAYCRHLSSMTGRKSSGTHLSVGNISVIFQSFETGTTHTFLYEFNNQQSFASTLGFNKDWPFIKLEKTYPQTN